MPDWALLLLTGRAGLEFGIRGVGSLFHVGEKLFDCPQKWEILNLE